MVQIEIYSNPDLSDDIQNESTEVNIIEENDSQTELTDVEKRAKRFEFTIMYFGQGDYKSRLNQKHTRSNPFIKFVFLWTDNGVYAVDA